MSTAARLELVPDDDPAALRLRPLSIAQLRALGAPRWLVRGILQRRTVALIWGASGSGKTFVALDMVAATVTGTRWNGRRVGQGSVVYVAGEGHLRDRLDALMAARGVSEDDLGLLRIVAARVSLLEAGADLLPLVDEIKAAGEDMGGVALVVLDTLNAMMSGGDENSSEDMGQMIAAARLLVEQIGCAVVFVHHAGKDAERGARGHSSLRAAVETELVIRDLGTHRTLTVEKQRDGETGDVFNFKLRPVDLGASEDPEAEPDERRGSCAVEWLDVAPAPPAKPVKRDVVLEALRQAVSEHGERLPGTSTIPPGTKATTLARWQARFRLLTGDDYKSDESASAAFRRARMAALKSGAAACSGTYAWPTSP
jgi:KaiC/GvpD/RAD55 family RecA-like ATPase